MKRRIGTAVRTSCSEFPLAIADLEGGSRANTTNASVLNLGLFFLFSFDLQDFFPSFNLFLFVEA